jgi:diguanylate cyclase
MASIAMNARTDLQPAALARLQACLAAAEPARSTWPPEAASHHSAMACAAAAEACDLALALGRQQDHAQATVWLCTHLMQQGRHTQVLQQAQASLEWLRQQTQGGALQAEWRELLRILTLAACEAGAFDVALDAAHELVRGTATLGEHGPALEAAFALAACFERMGDSWQAVRLLNQALLDHGLAAPQRPLLVATNGLCAIAIGMVYRLRGTVADAELNEVLQRARQAGEQALAMLPQVPDPVYEVVVGGNLGEVLLLQGDLDEAQTLLRQALARAQQRGLQAHAWRIQVSLGALQVAQGQPAQAAVAIQELLDQLGPDGPQQTRIRAHQVAHRACRALADPAGALAHFEQAEVLERRCTIAQLRAQSQLFVTRAEAQQAQSRAEQARHDADQQRQLAAEFAASAERDPLTGLGNRRHLDRRCAELFPAAQRDKRPVSVAQIDIDHFKLINDTYGHAAGDRVLVMLAQLLRDNTRQADVLARNGGEEFVVLLPDMDLAQASEVCERLRARVAARVWGEADARGGRALSVTISIGLASGPPYDAAALLQSADEALYRAKRGGRNRLATAQ